MKKTQKEFWGALTQSEEVASADLSFLSQANVEGDFGTADKFEIYRYAYRARIADSLKEDFAHLLEAAGETRFDSWLETFFIAGGSSQFSLVDTAWDFYRHLTESESAAAGIELNEREAFYLLLDFNLVILFYADSKVHKTENLAGESSDVLMQKTWTLSKHCILMDLPSDKKFFALYKNEKGFVEDRSISAIEYRFLKYFSQQALTLEECAELILANEEWKNSVNEWIGEVAGWFARWSQDQILTPAAPNHSN